MENTVKVNKYDHIIGNVSRYIVAGSCIAILAFSIANPTIFRIILKLVSFGMF